MYRRRAPYCRREPLGNNQRSLRTGYLTECFAASPHSSWQRHNPPHDFGSTKAETRITRLAVGEGEHYLPFVARSHEIWRELEQRSGEQLLHQCGGYIVTEQTPVEGQRWQDFVLETDRIARGAGIEFTVLDETSHQPPPARIAGLDGKRIGFEPTAGLVMAERAVAAQLTLAAGAGASLHTDETVAEVIPDAAGVEVVTDRGQYRAEQVVLAAGPWLGDLIDREDVSDRCVKAGVCLYTNTPDDHFLIDNALGSDRVMMMSPCSGHGFKHSAALGEAVAQGIATGRSDLDLTRFARSRFG